MPKLTITGLDPSLGMRGIEYEGDDVNFLQVFASVGQMHQAAIDSQLRRGVVPMGYVLQQAPQLALPAAPTYPALPPACTAPATQQAMYEQPYYPVDQVPEHPQATAYLPPVKNGRNYLGIIGTFLLSAIAIGMVSAVAFPAFLKSMPKMEGAAAVSPKPSISPSPSPKASPASSKGVGKSPSAKKPQPKTSSTCLTLSALFWATPIVTRAVGGAEGTRRPDGGKNRAYYGHSDPGNAVWNLGTFSYQHGASSPEEADRKQVRRLLNQALELERRAIKAGMRLTVEEILNGIDLANQAPLAALAWDGGAYLDRLKQAKKKGLTGRAAIVEARAKSYIDGSGRLNAPGLGNNMSRVYQDQERRAIAIWTAVEFNKQILKKAGGSCEAN